MRADERRTRWNPDRTVHGVNAARDAEIVRYARTGKWYLEPIDFSRRRQLTLAAAAHTAYLGTAILDRPGGLRFDAKVRAEQAAAHPVTCTTCGAPLTREPNVGWVDARSGDDGGTYDLCHDMVRHAPALEEANDA